MVNSCVVCGRCAEKENFRSLHRFPENQQKKAAWAEALGIEAERIQAKNIFVCSDHFSKESFVHFLRKGALPQAFYPCQVQDFPSEPSGVLVEVVPEQGKCTSVRVETLSNAGNPVITGRTTDMSPVLRRSSSCFQRSNIRASLKSPSSTITALSTASRTLTASPQVTTLSTCSDNRSSSKTFNTSEGSLSPPSMGCFTPTAPESLTADSSESPTRSANISTSATLTADWSNSRTLSGTLSTSAILSADLSNTTTLTASEGQDVPENVPSSQSVSRKRRVETLSNPGSPVITGRITDMSPVLGRSSSCFQRSNIRASLKSPSSTITALSTASRTLTASPQVTALSTCSDNRSSSKTFNMSEGSLSPPSMGCFTPTTPESLTADSSESPTRSANISTSATLTADWSNSRTLSGTLSPSAILSADLNNTTTITASEGQDVPENVPSSQSVSRKRKTTRKAYIGDINDSDFTSPKRAKRAFNIAKTKAEKKSKQLRVAQNTIRRLKDRILNLKSLLTYLKEHNYISESAEQIIDASVPGQARELIKRMLKGPTRQKYSPALRSFALTLHFYSPRAYKFVRETFNNSLPHPSTLSQWYQAVDGSPGFTNEAIEALKQRVKSSSHPVFCSLSMDEMSIRQKVEWTGTKFTGYVDVGTNLNSDLLPEAKEALVFLVTAVNAHFKVPVGYFFISGLSGSEKANLVRQCLEVIHTTGVHIISLTFDGAASNISMANNLGADLSPNAIRPFFNHPITNKKVFVFLDIAHMIKLIRNCLGSAKVITTEGGKLIQWSFFEKLVTFQNIEGLVAANKIKKRHLLWVREKMKVKIAAQTLSKSVSDALDFLREDFHIADFKDSEETSKFCKLINDVFDVLNSRTHFCAYFYKKPFSTITEPEFLKLFNNIKKYFSELYINGVPLLTSNRKTGFIGFLVGIESFLGLYEEHIKTTNLKYLLGYKFSQDHLEAFFSAVRSRHGFNNNPTAKQFEASFKKLLIATQIKASDAANVAILDETTILNCSSSRRKLTTNDDGEDLQNSKYYVYMNRVLEDHDYLGAPAWHLTCYAEDIVIYISGFIVRSLKKVITCFKCIQMLESEDSLSKLQKRKRYGKLTNASEFVCELCILAEKQFKLTNATVGLFNRNIKNMCKFLCNNTVANLPENIFQKFDDHFFYEEVGAHAMGLIKLIFEKYFQLRIHHETRKMSDNIERVRSVLTKQILFKNQ